MFKIEKRPSGILLTFGGFIQKEEMEDWLAESRRELLNVERGFGVIVDMRALAPLHADAKEVMVRGQEMYRKAGMKRSAVILNNVITTFQFRNIALQSGIHVYERYFDASSNANWEEQALNWVKFGVEPDEDSARKEGSSQSPSE